jgi:DNA-binding CsgD family transcriptional regulator
MKPDRAFSNLVGRIYDCALDMSLWTNVLGEITEAVDGAMANVISADPLRGQQTFLLSWNLSDDLAALVLENAPLNPTLPFGLTMPLCEPTTASRVIDLEAFHRSRYWTTCFTGRGYYDCVAAALTRTVSTFTAIGIFGDDGKGAYADDDIEVARLLMPHIKRSLEIAGVLGRQRVEVDTLHAALGALADVALIIEADGAILYGNEAAKAELAKARIVRERENRLLGVTREAAGLLDTLSTPAGRMRHRGLEARLSDRTGHALYATWASLDAADQGIAGPVLLLLREPEAALETPLSAAAALYALTPGETLVLAQILNGCTLLAAAEILGVARSTVKSHLDAIYGKTGTNRQSELVKLVMSLSSPLRR